MCRRLPLLLCLIVGLDLVLLLAVTWWVSWKVTLIQNILSAILGIAVIIRYELRWSRMVAENLGVDDSESLGDHGLEKLLLLGAGILLLIPGLLSDLFGLLLLVPWIRRKTASILLACRIDGRCAARIGMDRQCRSSMERASTSKEGRSSRRNRSITASLSPRPPPRRPAVRASSRPGRS